jgi:anti-anti-sigma factor
MVLQITERAVGDVTVLNLKGRLVLEECVTLRDAVDALVQQRRPKLVLDLQDVNYIDSAGLGILVAKYLSVRRLGGDMKIVHPTPRSLHVLEITHLNQVFETFASEDAAIRSFDVAASNAARN